MKTSKINHCRACSSNDLELVKVFNDYPLFDDVVCSHRRGSEYTDILEIILCANCGLLQNPKNIDFEEYYSYYVYSSGLSKFAIDYMSKLAQKTTEIIHSIKPLKVIDVGSGDGKLLECFKQYGCDVLGFEGSSILSQRAAESGINTINSLFNNSANSLLKEHDYGSPDLICMLHTFDHLPNPVEMLELSNSLLKEGGHLLIEVHSLDKMITQNEGAIFAHEHTCYYSEITLKNLLNTKGFQIIDYNFIDENMMRGASQVILCKKVINNNFKLRATSLIGSSTKMFIDRLDKANHNVKAYIKNKTSDSYRIAGFGGWGRGIGSIAQAQLDSTDLYCVFDNNKSLNNCFIPEQIYQFTCPEKNI